MNAGEPFPYPNTEAIYIYKNDLIYLGDGEILTVKIPGSNDRGYSVHSFLPDKPIIWSNATSNAFIFDLSSKTFTPVVPHEGYGVQSFERGLVYIQDFIKNHGYIYDYRGEDLVVTPVQYPHGYEGKYSYAIFPRNGEGELLFIDNFSNTMSYGGLRLMNLPYFNQEEYEDYDDIFFYWLPPYFMAGAGNNVHVYRLKQGKDSDNLRDYATGTLTLPDTIVDSTHRGFILSQSNGARVTYSPRIEKDSVGFSRDPDIIDGNVPDRDPEISPTMKTFLDSLGRKVIVYTHRKLREMVNNNPAFSPRISKLIAMYI